LLETSGIFIQKQETLPSEISHHCCPDFIQLFTKSHSQHLAVITFASLCLVHNTLAFHLCFAFNSYSLKGQHHFPFGT